MRVSGAVIAAAVLCFAISADTRAQAGRDVRISTDVLAVGMPAAAFAATLLGKDYDGAKQLFYSGATAMAATYAMKFAVGKERRDGSNSLSFPSAHSTAGFATAGFLQRRYGLRAGIPAYVVSTYIAWGRIYARKHDIWDVAAGAAIGMVSSYVYTRPFADRHDLVIAPVTIDGKAGAAISLRF